jgi:hypothetical protein
VIALAELERDWRERRALGRFADAYLHRAVHETSIGHVHGRDALTADALRELAELPPQTVTIEADLGDMIAYRIESGAGSWRGHRWARREGGRIAAEILVEETEARCVAAGSNAAEAARKLAASIPAHHPLGELSAGRGQLAAAADVPLPPGFPEAAHAAAQWLHRLWNGRELDLAPESGLEARLLSQTLGAVLLVEQGIAAGDRVAILWRLHGQHATKPGRRLRLIGSSLFTVENGKIVADATLVDELAIAVQLRQPLLDYE